MNFIFKLAFLFLTLTFLSFGIASPVIEPDGFFDIRGNYISNEAKKFRSRSNCCLIPVCENYRNCYDTIECGYKCTTGNYQPATYGPTPGYKRRDSYVEYQCIFDKCKTYEFLCNHCPKPEDVQGFSIYTVRKDCRNCYYTVLE